MGREFSAGGREVAGLDRIGWLNLDGLNGVAGVWGGWVSYRY